MTALDEQGGPDSDLPDAEPVSQLISPSDGGIEEFSLREVDGEQRFVPADIVAGGCGRSRRRRAARAWGEPYLAQKGLLSTDGVFAAASGGLTDLTYIEAFPTSPMILAPFTDPLPIPKALVPVPKSMYSKWANPPGPGQGQQNSSGNERHQIWPSQLGYPDPIVYKIDCLVRQHAFTTSQVPRSTRTANRRSRSTSPASPTRPAPTERCRCR